MVCVSDRAALEDPIDRVGVEEVFRTEGLEKEKGLWSEFWLDVLEQVTGESSGKKSASLKQAATTLSTSASMSTKREQSAPVSSPIVPATTFLS